MNIQSGSTTLRFDTLDWERIEHQLQKSHDREHQEDGKGRQLCCAACRQPITREDQRMFVQNRHEHVFSNPHGVVFRIGCFAMAPGCAHLGESTEEWTWFRGYRWQIAVCTGCGAHMGWRYTSRGSDTFHGLVLRYLIVEDNDL